MHVPVRMVKSAAVAVALLLVAGLAMAVAPMAAEGGGARNRFFEPVATFDVIAGNGSAVAEIVDASPDGNQLAYTDADNEEVGFVDITDETNPVGQGTVAVGGEPTSLVIRDDLVLVGVNTSPSFVAPSGALAVIDRTTLSLVATIPVDGQPDSIALSPDGEWLAIVIENERDEDLGDGLIPQLPTGGLLIASLDGDPATWTPEAADLSPVAASAFAGSDLEPEYVDINEANLAVVSFQENNHLAVVDVTTGTVVSEFSAGEVTLTDVDTEEEDLINLDSTITKRREPDAVSWIDHDSFATANEGDYEDADGNEGGSRGFTIFNVDGTVEYESAESFEHWLVSAGHYPEGRSENKGVEPEAVEFGTFGRRANARDLLFVGSERGNAVGVYDVTGGEPYPVQLLPTGLGPEGLKAIPGRDLFIVATEADEAGDGIPTMINIFRRSSRQNPYPGIVSGNDASGNPIPWVALSGLVGDFDSPDTVHAVSDSFLASGFIYTIDVGVEPAQIVERIEIVGASADLDPEGIAMGRDRHFWVGSEGNASSRPNLILKVDRHTGDVLMEIELPAELVDERRGNGIEGIAVTGRPGREQVYVAIQRAWPDEGDTDEVNTKIGRYDVATGTWGFVHYPLQPEGAGDWVGLSELTRLPNGTFAVIERDKGWGPSTGFVAELKAVYGIDLANAEFRAFDDPRGLVTIEKYLLRDLLPDLEEVSIWTAEKVEGLAVTADRRVYVVTDNDGVDDAPGETLFLRLGRWRRAFDLP